jgi:hypothetical protein
MPVLLMMIFGAVDLSRLYREGKPAGCAGCRSLSRAVAPRADDDLNVDWRRFESPAPTHRDGAA